MKVKLCQFNQIPTSIPAKIDVDKLTRLNVDLQNVRIHGFGFKYVYLAGDYSGKTYYSEFSLAELQGLVLQNNGDFHHLALGKLWQGFLIE